VNSRPFSSTPEQDKSSQTATVNLQGYIYWKIPPPPPGRGNISRWHLGEKIGKGEEKKGENVKEKGRKRKEKGKKGKENEKRVSKRVK
jgi:hypothetical protein